MKKEKIKKSVFLKYLFSYLIILVLPIIVLIIFIHVRYYRVLQEEIRKNEMNSLEIVQIVSDEQLLQIENLQSQIVLDKEFTPFLLFGNINNSIECIKKLAIYRNTNNLIDEIAIYHNIDEFIYTNQGSYKEDMFIKTKFIVDFEHIKSNRSSELKVYSVEKIAINSEINSKSTMLAFPLTKGKGMVLVFLNNNPFTKVMKENYDQKMSMTFVLNQDNELIASANNEGTDLFLEDIDAVNVSNAQRYQENRVVGGKKYLFSLCDSSKTELVYVSYTPVSNAMVKATSIQREMLWVLLLLFLAAFIVIGRALHITYAPVKQLENYAKTIFGEPTESLDAFEKVQETLKYLEDKNLSLTITSKKASYEYMLRNLLKGRYSLEEFNHEGKDYGLSIKFPLFQVITIEISRKRGGDGEIPTTTIAEVIAEDVELNGYFIDSLSDKNIIGILNFGYEESVESRIKELHKRLQKEFSSPVTIGLGEIFHEIEKVVDSCMQSSYAVDYQFVKGKNSIIRSSEVVLNDTYMSNYPFNELNKLEYFLDKGNNKEVRESLDTLLLFIKSPSVPMLISRRLCLQMVSIITKAVGKMNLKSTTANAYSLRILLSEFETADELLEVMKNISTNLCMALKESKTEKIELLDELYEYIDKEYAKPDFSLKSIADKFDIQITYLSQYFKNKTQKTVLEYVTDLRMEQAKRLLLAKENSVGEVANLVGYISDSSFIRRFKQYTGMTPGQYVKRNM